jgi:hypothetical protein
MRFDMQKTAPQKEKIKQETIITLRGLAHKWPSNIVARSEIKQFSGGLLAPGTAANNDSIGVGIPGAFRVSRKIAYPVESAIDWLIARLEA